MIKKKRQNNTNIDPHYVSIKTIRKISKNQQEERCSNFDDKRKLTKTRQKNIGPTLYNMLILFFIFFLSCNSHVFLYTSHYIKQVKVPKTGPLFNKIA